MKEFSYQEDPDRAGNKTNKLQRGQYEIKMLIYSIIPVKRYPTKWKGSLTICLKSVIIYIT